MQGVLEQESAGGPGKEREQGKGSRKGEKSLQAVEEVEGVVME